MRTSILTELLRVAPGAHSLLPLAGLAFLLLWFIHWMKQESDRYEATLDFRHQILRLTYAPFFGRANERVFPAGDVLAVDLIHGDPSRLVLQLAEDECFDLDSSTSEPPLESLGTEIARVFEKPFRRSSL